MFPLFLFRGLVSMTVILNRLRDVATHDVGNDGVTIEDRLTQLMIDIGTTVNQCGNVCDSMEKSGFFSESLEVYSID